ncbi:MAG: DUF2306 domain-containing protein [Vitreoscilla sp.]|nr:DUF2306 domain-containing protein [Vitreoscilla sp.]
MTLRTAYWLVALSVVPLLGGVARLAGLAGVDRAPMDTRFAHNPLPAIVHIVAASVFSVLGAFQFESGLRRAWPRWHRYAGRVLVLCGLLTAATGVWMTVQYAIPRPVQGSLLFGVRLAVGGAMALSLVLAVKAIREGNVPSHQAWMLRAYALGLGAGTQVFFLLPPELISGEPVTGILRDALMTAAWAANLLVAEFAVRRPVAAVQCPPGLHCPHGLSSHRGGARS